MENSFLYNKLIEQVMSQRPDLAPYAELFQQMSSSGSSESENPTTVTADMRFKKLASAARLLKEDFDEAMDELDDLAKALGACEICWGDNKKCEKCRGKGRSGYFLPDERLFRLLIMPAVKRMSAQQIPEYQ